MSVVQSVLKIDCSKMPRAPKGHQLKGHLRRGIIELSPGSVILHRTALPIRGRKLVEEIGTRALCAWVLRFMLKNPGNIPPEWWQSEHTDRVCFPSTTYTDPQDREYAYCLEYNGRSRPKQSIILLDENFGPKIPVPVLLEKGPRIYSTC